MTCGVRNKTDFTHFKELETFWSYFQTDEKYAIYTASAFLHVTSLILIITTAYMFVRHKTLRTAEHLVHINLLVSDSLLLLSDWVLFEGTMAGCEIYSVSFIVFGSSSIYTAAVIAYTRYEQMRNRSSQSSSLNKHPIICLLCIWAASLLTTLLPIISKAEQFFSDEDMTGHVCFFAVSLVYERKGQSVIFFILVILIPATIMSFCYIRIYQSVRQARITRWLNQAAQLYSTHTRIIKGHPRRANIVPRKLSEVQYPMQPNAISDREKHILIKGLFSVASQLLFWVPFSIAWLINTNTGFKQDFVLKQIFIMILAKCSVITNICHYITFNIKFRKLYFKTLINPVQKFCCRGNRTIIVGNVSQTNSGLAALEQTTKGSGTQIPLRRITEIVSPGIPQQLNTEKLPSTLDTTDKVRSLSVPSRSNSVFPM